VIAISKLAIMAVPLPDFAEFAAHHAQDGAGIAQARTEYEAAMQVFWQAYIGAHTHANDRNETDRPWSELNRLCSELSQTHQRCVGEVQDIRESVRRAWAHLAAFEATVRRVSSYAG
jgi:hypothetical protein